MLMKIIDGEFSVLKVKNFEDISFEKEYCFACKRDNEYSLVVKTADAPKNYLKKEDGWIAMIIEGELDFSIVGIMAKISNALANEGVAMFAISTYDTDCILIKRENLLKAVNALKKTGFEVY